jgi:hypothetical protein
MIVAANIGVIDEVELIERHVRHLQAIGVDRIVVTDTGSTDGTAEILQAFADRREIVLLRVGRQDPDALQFANRMLRYTLDEIRPDWILFGDADEFHIPRTGSIRDALDAATVDVFRVPRFNVPVGASGPLWPADLGPARYGDLQLIVRQIAKLEERMLAEPQTPWIMGRIVPKIIARADAVAAGIRMGAHRPLPQAGAAPMPAQTIDVLIAHLAIAGRERFLRKLDNIRLLFASVEDRFPPSEAWHWRRWLRLAEQGRAGEEYERQVFDGATLAALQAAGTVMSAAQWFAAPVSASPQP